MPGGDGCDAEAYRGQSWEGCRFICSVWWAMGCFVLCKGSAQVGCSGGWSGDVCGIFIFIFLIGCVLPAGEGGAGGICVGLAEVLWGVPIPGVIALHRCAR